MDLKNTNYCKVGGLGFGSDERCHTPCKECTKRTLNGGPDISSAQQAAGQQPGNELGVVIPDSVNSKEKLSEYLQALGHIRGSITYMDLYKEYSKSLQSETSYLNK